MLEMNLYQGDEGPTNDPGHAVEHLLYDVAVQVLPWIGFLLESRQFFFFFFLIFKNLVGNFLMR